MSTDKVLAVLSPQNNKAKDLIGSVKYLRNEATVTRVTVRSTLYSKQIEAMK